MTVDEMTATSETGTEIATVTTVEATGIGTAIVIVITMAVTGTGAIAEAHHPPRAAGIHLITGAAGLTPGAQRQGLAAHLVAPAPGTTTPQLLPHPLPRMAAGGDHLYFISPPPLVDASSYRSGMVWMSLCLGFFLLLPFFRVVALPCLFHFLLSSDCLLFILCLSDLINAAMVSSHRRCSPTRSLQVQVDGKRKKGNQKS